MAFREEAGYRLTAIDGGQRAFRSFSAGLKGVDKLAFKLNAGLAAAAGAAGLGLVITRTLDATDKLDKLSTRLGVSTEALSEYRHVAKLTGVEQNQLTTGWQRMTRRIAEAAKGTGEAKGAIRELGLQAEALNRLSPDQQFEALADAISKVENPADRVRLAMKLFDSEGVSLLQTMEKGAVGIRAMREEARALGQSLSRDQVQAAVDAKDAMTRLGAQFSAVRDKLIIELAPALEIIASTLQTVLPGAAAIAGGAIKFMARSIAFGLGNSIEALGFLMEQFAKLPTMIGLEGLSDIMAPMADDMREFAARLLDFALTGQLAGDNVIRITKEGAGGLASEFVPAVSAATEQLREAAFASADWIDKMGQLNVRSKELGKSVGLVTNVARDVGSNVSTEIGGAFDGILAKAAEGANLFEKAWLSVIGSVAGALSDQLGKEITKGLLSLLPGGTIIGGLFGAKAGIPPSTADFVRVNIAQQEAAQHAASLRIPAPRPGF